MGTRAHTYSPAYKMDEFPEILRYSSHVTFNSLHQFGQLKDYVAKSGNKISMGLRVNPGFSKVKTELYNPVAPGTRLGMDYRDLPFPLPTGIEGLHFHTLFEDDSYTLEKTIDAFEQRFGKFLPHVKWVNMGGGHLITGENYDRDHLIGLIKAFSRKYKVNVILEPGTAYAWQTGVLVSTIVDITEDNGIRTAILDVSFTAHMPDCLEMPYKPVISGANNEETPGFHAYRMGGNSCLAGDYMGNWWFPRELKPGDKIIFEDMIHYTMVKTTMFNGVKHPSIATWSKKNGLKILKEFGYHDYKNRLS
jgi:carboxynorspermidine decarboxylase